ncbi:hypothetical protein GQ42DRAFT_161339 [Ramicandelaber brevisporus]|nr:hypothetical protein GQ42DRAFT_161339 [Ramicandelaber brevisporus]
MGEYEEPVMVATQKEMQEHRIPLQFRDFCAHLLIPLNSCRRDNFYLPWRCNDERHTYEKCQYDDVMRRMKKAEKIKQERDAAAAAASAASADN